jgi:hypothetical protein
MIFMQIFSFKCPLFIQIPINYLNFPKAYRHLQKVIKPFDYEDLSIYLFNFVYFLPLFLSFTEIYIYIFFNN